MHALLTVIDMALNLYMWCLIIRAVLSWLISFNVLNTSNPTVYRIADFFEQITEPALRPIRRVIPPIGGIDISPVILILVIVFIRNLIWDNYFLVAPHP